MSETLKIHVQHMIDCATYSDGNATVPAFLLEQLADLAGVKLSERRYTENT